MKKILIALFVVACGTTLSAQTALSTSSVNKMEQKDNAKLDKEITDALMKDLDLQRQTVRHLQSKKETRVAMGEIAQSTDGTEKAMMYQILQNEELTKVAVAYVKETPELMKKVKAISKK